MTPTIMAAGRVTKIKAATVHMIQATNAPSEEYRKIIAVTSQIMPANIPICQTSANKAPKNVATPFPPLKPNQIG